MTGRDETDYKTRKTFGLSEIALNVQINPVGTYLREWRQRRRLSQLDFALQAEISQRHLSFIESGRSVPGREMVIRLGESLELPLREP